MDFLLISDNKLKIMLDNSEMIKYKLDSPELDYSNPDVRNSFWQILDEARAACGFDAKGEKVLIQFYPAKSGGEIFITKLGALSRSAERSISGSDRVAMLSSETKIYKFDTLGALVDAVHTASDIISEDSEVFLSEAGNFYLLTEERNSRGALGVSEFGTEVPASLEWYIKERARPLEEPISSLKKLKRI